MAKNQPRSGIERKFLTSIVWVGVVPMFLALTIGYVFAREGQLVATKHNQLTEARKTAEGITLAMDSRLRMAARVALDKDLVRALKQLRDGEDFDLDMALRRLRAEAAGSGDLASQLALYDHQPKFLAATEASAAWKGYQPPPVTQPVFTEILDNAMPYAARIVSPVREAGTGAILGYVVETQVVQDLLEYVLGDVANRDVWAGENNYEVVYASPLRTLTVYLDGEAPAGQTRLKYGKLDPELADRLMKDPDVDADDFFLWRYQTCGKKTPVILAYHRLFLTPSRDAARPKVPLFFVVYRPAAAVFANINLAAVLTIVVSSVVIAFFCIVGYRIVNNNIIRPVSLLNEGAQIVRQGDLELKLKIDTGDEIEELASSFNEMATALRHNITQLGESEEKHRSLIDSMHDGIYQCDNGSVLTFVNPAGARYFGYTDPEEALGLNLRDVFIEEMDYARFTKELKRRRFVEHTRVWIATPRVQSLCVEVSANTLFDDRGEAAGVEGTFRDVTQNVRLEQQARDRSDRINAINQITNAINSSLEAGRAYESIVAQIRTLVNFDYAAISLLPDGGQGYELRRLWPEPDEGASAVLQLDGVEPAAAWVERERKTLVVGDLQHGDSPFSSQFPEEIRSCLCVPLHAAGRIIGTLNLGAQTVKAFSRHEIEVLEQLTPHVAVAIRNAKLLENLQHSLEQVTQAREKLHAANEELKTLDEMKTNLLSNVSHELRTPLVAVMGYTDMILNGKVGPVNEVQQEYLGISVRNIEKLVTLIENLLDFSRLHRGAEEMVFDALDIVACAKTGLEIVRPVAGSREIALILNAPQGDDGNVAPVSVEGDKGKLGQVFNNLLSNAVKFNQNGGSVTVDIRPTEANVEVIVSDTGIGVPEEAQDKIFTRFYQYDSSSTRKYGGTGIGLSIAQDIMRLHGSRITVQSNPEGGAIFRFSLPLSGLSDRDSGEERSRLPLPTETHLLVELVSQDRALSAQIRNLLVAEGMDVIHAAYPSVALSLANKYNPDCMLVDTEAGPTGDIVIEEILAQPCVSDIPIVLLTNDEALFDRYREADGRRGAEEAGKQFATVTGRVKRGFRKSSLLGGIHAAMSKGVASGRSVGPRVLCVDDDPEIVRFIKRCLGNEGFTVDGATTGDEALERAQGGAYWLVLLDIAMPGLDGWETCKALKSNAALVGLKVYMVTAKPLGTGGARGLRLERMQDSGADGYLLKPFKAEDLVELVTGIEPQEVFHRRRQAAMPVEDRPLAATDPIDLSQDLEIAHDLEISHDMRVSSDLEETPDP